VNRDYFVRMASDANLEVRESIGLVCGQPTVVFAKR